MATYLRLGPALIHFLNNVTVNIIQNNVVVNLMDQLPMLKNGAVFASLTLINLFKLYIKINHLNRPNNMFVPNNLCLDSFGDIIPAEFVFFPSYQNKISMTDAVARGIVPFPVNTFDAITISDPSFNPLLVSEEYLFDLVELNSHEPLGDSPQLYDENNLIMQYFITLVLKI